MNSLNIVLFEMVLNIADLIQIKLCAFRLKKNDWQYQTILKTWRHVKIFNKGLKHHSRTGVKSK